MRFGKIDQQTSNSTVSYFQLATGPTSARPSPATNGQIRYNSTNSRAEYYANTGWNNAPMFGNTTISVQNLTLPDASPTGNMIYWRDPATYNKTLSVMMLNYRFSVATAYKDTWLQVDPSITGSNVGYVVPTAATLTFMTGFTDNASNKSISLYVDDTEYTNRMIFTSSGDITDQAVSSPINIDIAAGQKIRLRVRSGSVLSLGSIVCILYFMLRK
jgi:hypothetical protein